MHVSSSVVFLLHGLRLGVTSVRLGLVVAPVDSFGDLELAARGSPKRGAQSGWVWRDRLGAAIVVDHGRGWQCGSGEPRGAFHGGVTCDERHGVAPWFGRLLAFGGYSGHVPNVDTVKQRLWE
jgi:hypothetical protein